MRGGRPRLVGLSDAFDFTVFLLIMVPIAEEFDVTAGGSGGFHSHRNLMDAFGGCRRRRLAGDRIGRKTPLIIFDRLKSQSLCEFHRRLFAKPLFSSCSVPCSASAWAPSGRSARRLSWKVAPPFPRNHERHPPSVGQSRIPAVQPSLRAALDVIGWRGLLMARCCRRSPSSGSALCQGPEVWKENRRLQGEQNKESAPRCLRSSGQACSAIPDGRLWMSSGFVVYYSVNGMFASHLQNDLDLDPALIATPIALANLLGVPRQWRLGLCGGCIGGDGP